MDNAAEIVWGPFEAMLRTLYMEQDLSLVEVMHKMATEYQFKATKSQYELQFKKWQFRKNCTAEEWKIVAQKLTARKGKRKETEVILYGNPIHPKKLRKETRRYGSLSAAIETLPSEGPSPPTPEGFIIRTPSPQFHTSISTPAEFYYANPLLSIGPVPMGCLPFHQFISVLGHAGNPFSHSPGSFDSDEVVLLQDMYSSILKTLTARNGKEISGSLNDALKALLPQNFSFHSSQTASHMEISQLEPSTVPKFLELAIYLLSNNFIWSNKDVGKELYKWIKRRSNTGLMEYLFSIGGPTVEALIENLFRLAIDAEDDGTIKKMIELGINPDEQVYRTGLGDCCTALKQACRMQSLKLVRALLDGGAKVDLSVGNDDTDSLLTDVVNVFDKDGNIKAHIDPELVQILLDAGVIVNPSSGESPLVHAVERGCVEVVELLVSAGADVNAGSESTPLISAASCKRYILDTNAISMVRILLKAGADPQREPRNNSRSYTALKCAISWKSIELIQLLLENGARVTEQSFVDAVCFGDLSVLNLLLKFGGQVTEEVVEYAVKYNSTMVLLLLEIADDSIKERCKNSALTKSIECGEMDLVHRLVASGGRLNTGSKLKFAIQEVIKAGNIDILCFLLDEKSRFRTVCLESLDGALWTAISNGWNDIAELLLMAGANVNGKDLNRSPLSAAIGQKNLHLTKQLLDGGAAVNFKVSYLVEGMINRLAISLLPSVVDWGHHPLIQDFINAGANIDATGSTDYRTALFIAVEKKDMGSVKLLIDAGANVNASGVAQFAHTALMAASQNNDLQMVQYLLRLGADSDDWSLTLAISGSLELVHTLLAARLQRYKRYSKGYGRGALQRAIELTNPTMIRLLLEKGIYLNGIIYTYLEGEVDDPFHICGIKRGLSALGCAVEMDKSEDSWIVRMLLRGGADPNCVVTPDRQTPLLVAVAQNSLAIVELLIEFGADANPSLRSGIQRTPLQHAAEKGRIDIVTILLDNGADVNAPPFDRYGATALQFAAIGGYIGIAQLLIEKEADVNAASAKIGGRTALEGAAEHGRIDMLQLLLSAGAQITGNGLAQCDRARELALKNGHRAACRLLENHSIDMFVNLAPWDDMGMGIDFSFLE